MACHYLLIRYSFLDRECLNSQPRDDDQPHFDCVASWAISDPIAFGPTQSSVQESASQPVLVRRVRFHTAGIDLEQCPCDCHGRSQLAGEALPTAVGFAPPPGPKYRVLCQFCP